MTISNSAPILDDCRIGDSIAVNGACLTVTEFDKIQQGGWFKVWLANETLERTDLGEDQYTEVLECDADSWQGEREVGDEVNLERAMGIHARFGGHFVQVNTLWSFQCKV